MLDELRREMWRNLKEVSVEYSVVVPVYNEEEVIEDLYEEIKNVLDKVGKSYEIIFVDDCSQDRSLEKLHRIFKKDKNVQVISLLGNHGQTLALSAGFKNSLGKVIIAMDGDGQHNPKYIPEFISAIEEGYDLVSGWKKGDKSRGIFSRFSSGVAHRIIAKLSGSSLRYSGATMKAYRREILKKMELSGDLHRFAGALVEFKGIKIKEIPIEIRQRKAGRSNYSANKAIQVILDLILLNFIIKYAKKPFRFFGFSGALLLLVGILGNAFVFLQKWLFGVSTASNASILIVSAIFLIAGVQFIFFGLIAELISRIYYTTNNKEYFIKRYHLKH
jgi:glycosyltransferase involved in cell wall biosynthesis